MKSKETVKKILAFAITAIIFFGIGFGTNYFINQSKTSSSANSNIAEIENWDDLKKNLEAGEAWQKFLEQAKENAARCPECGADLAKK